MFLNITRCIIFLTSLLLISACSRYSVAINERLVYGPPSLFSNYNIADDALRRCVSSTIAEDKLTAAEQLQIIVCPSGNIKSLEGLQIFTTLEVLGLAGNQIHDLSPLATLVELKQLNLKSNLVEDGSALINLKQLELLNLADNPTLLCDSIKFEPSTTQVIFPAHCLN